MEENEEEEEEVKEEDAGGGYRVSGSRSFPLSDDKHRTQTRVLG